MLFAHRGVVSLLAFGGCSPLSLASTPKYTASGTLEQQTWWMVLVVSIADATLDGIAIVVGGFLYFVTQLFAHIRTDVHAIWGACA